MCVVITSDTAEQKLKRGTISIEKMVVSAKALDTGYDQAFILQMGKNKY